MIHTADPRLYPSPDLSWLMPFLPWLAIPGLVVILIGGLAYSNWQDHRADERVIEWAIARAALRALDTDVDTTG